MTTKVTMPQLGESVVEGTVGQWLVKEGERVDKDQPIVEILTDKADSEVPAPVAGVVVKLHAGVDDVVAVGEPLCEIDENAEATASSGGGDSKDDGGSKGEDSSAKGTSDDGTKDPSGGDAVASPSVRKLAREEGVDLGSVKGTGEGGRITQEDVRKAASGGGEPAPAPSSTSSGRAEAVPPPPRQSGGGGAPRPAFGEGGLPKQGPMGAFKLPPYRESPGDEVVPFSRRRRIIADHMLFSKMVSPEVVTFAECDLQATAKLRDQHKGQYKKEGYSLTYLAFVVAAPARALREFPELNARVLDDAYVKLRDVNLGIAVDTPKGLVVPVIRNADELTIRGLARAIIDLAERARDGNLTPDDLANKTFTISNPGRKGNLVGGAIISQPNVGILRIGTIKKRPVVVEQGGEDFIAIHPVMYMALTYDHRVVDGVHANGFLYRVSEILEQGDFEL